ncbi:MAG: adenylate/guanylate cyclase domain-containing protein [Gallionella sp.]|jgi:hypothetical protein
MEDRSNKTIICSVLFLDIVEYSKKSVTGQISLKDRFNTYLSEAIHDVPVTDRIILDTGDGAAVNFLGDVESALTAAMRLRESLLSEDPGLEPKLLVRIGINLGPVRLVRDINGQPNIVGDGINVAQRVMAFADASQILVSRSYYDAVSRLSSEYTGMFHYQGSRTDKHVREHEVYAIGYPGDQADMPVAVESVPASQVEIPDQAVAATMKRRILYAAIGTLIVSGAALLIFKPGKSVQSPQVETMPAASAVVAASHPVPAAPAVEKSDKPVADNKPVADKPQVSAKPKTEPLAAKKTVAPGKPVISAKSVVSAKPVESHAQNKEAAAGKSAADPDVAEPGSEARITVSCKDDTQVFVDGSVKGKISQGSITVTTKPGKHKVILTHPSFGMFADEVSVEPGKTGRIRPKVCN